MRPSPAATVAAILGLLVGGQAGAAEGPDRVSAKSLRVSVRADDATWRLGATVALRATLTNTGSSPVVADLFGELNEVYEGKRRQTAVTSCWALSWSPRVVASGVPRGRYPLAASQFHRLAPGESVTKPLTFLVQGVQPGRYEVRLAYMPRAATASFSLPDHWETQHGFRDRTWIGMAFSDPLTVQIVP